MPIRYSPSGSASRPDPSAPPTPMVNPLTVALGRVPAGSTVNPEVGDTFQLTATWSRAVSTFTGGASRAFVLGGNIVDGIHAFASPDSTVYTITVTPPVDTEGNITYIVPRNSAAAMDDSTPGPDTRQSITVRYNVLKPDIVWDWDSGRDVTGSNITIGGEWNQPVNGFAQGDLDITWHDQGGMTGTVTLTHTDGGTASSLNISFPAASRGYVLITIMADSVESDRVMGRTGPTRPNTLTVSYDSTMGGGPPIDDTTPPTLTIEEPAIDPWRARSLTLDFLWSERVVGFAMADVMPVPNTVTVSNFEAVPGDGTIIVDDQLFRVTFAFPASFDSSVTISVPANSVTDVAGNPNALTSITFDVDTLPEVSGFTNQDGTNAVEICAETFGIDVNPYIHDSMGMPAGGYFIGVLEMEKLGDDIYMVVQVQRKRDGRSEPAYQQEAAGALVHVSLASNACTIIERYNHITLAPRSMVVHDGAVHMFYCSHYVYINPPDRDDDWRESVAFIRKIVNINQLELVARPYRYRARISNNEDVNVGWGGGTSSPMLSVGDELHMISGYDSLDFVHDNTRDAAQYNNWQWNVLRQKLNRRLPKFDTNNRIGFDALKELALITDSIIGFDENGFFMKDRSTVSASLSGDIADTGDVPTINYAGRNRDFPSGAGMIAINNEVFTYTDVNATEFTGVERAQERTSEQAHMGGSTIYHIDHTLSLADSALYKPIESMNVELNRRQHYNIVELTYGTGDRFFDPVVSVAPETRTSASITAYGERVYKREIPLARHQGVFGDFIAQKLLDRLGNLQYIITLDLKLTLFAKIGDYIYFQQQEKAHLQRVCQVIGLTHNINKGQQSTTMTLVTI